MAFADYDPYLIKTMPLSSPPVESSRLSSMNPVLLPPTLLAQLDIAVFRREQDDAFTLMGSPPNWLKMIYPKLPTDGTTWNPGDHLMYLAHFIKEAEQVWSAEDSIQLTSDVWTEEDLEGREWLLEAIALKIGEQDMLLVKFPSNDFKTLRSVYQEARDQSLKHYNLLKEIDKREVLLHCTVHDLSAPLAGIRASLWLMHEDKMVQPVGEEFLEIGLEQVDKMQHLINETLTTFSTRSKPLLQSSDDLQEAPNVAESVRDVTEALTAMAALKGVTFRISSEGPDDTMWEVVGDHARLERILFNLLENALRHTKDQSEIVVRLRDEGNTVRVSIKDQGEGVPDDIIDQLFEKFSQSGEKSGKVGLGLYFCRITVESWGGEIGCLPNMRDGACFWFTLPKAGQNGTAG